VAECHKWQSTVQATLVSMESYTVFGAQSIAGIEKSCRQLLKLRREVMNEDLREAIGLLRKINPPAVFAYPDVAKAVEIITLRAEQVLEAQDELPAKKDETYVLPFLREDVVAGVTKANFTETDKCAGFNEALSLCQPILAKKNLRIRELERQVKKLSALNGITGIGWEEK
jgi:hypothetical protein